MGVTEEDNISLFLLTEICEIHETFLDTLYMTVSDEKFFIAYGESLQGGKFTVPVAVAFDTQVCFIWKLLLNSLNVVVTVTAEYHYFCIIVFFESLQHGHMVSVRV